MKMRSMIYSMFFLILILSIPCYPQTSVVSATITDSDGQTWNNGTFSVVFVPSPTAPQQVQCNGSSFTSGPVTGNLNASGVFSVALQQNTNCFPVGSTWQFSICPNASSQCTTMKNIVVGSSALSVSTLFSAQVTVPRFSAAGITTSRGYLDTEVTPTPLPGGSYWNVTNNCQRVWSGAIWACNGTSFPAGSTNGVVQFYQGGAFGSSVNFIWNTGTNSLTINGTTNLNGVNNLVNIGNFDGIQYVDSALSRGGSDIGAEINLAYANCPANGCQIKVAPNTYIYTTPIVFGTLGKPVVLDCGGSTNGVSSNPAAITGSTRLNYTPTTATTAITVASGGIGGSGVTGCTLIGAGAANPTVGLQCGTSSGGVCEGNVFRNDGIQGFGVGIQMDGVPFATTLYDMNVSDNGKALNLKGGNGNEKITFIGGIFSNQTIGTTNCVDSSSATVAYDIRFIAMSLDNCGVTINGAAGHKFRFGFSHLENFSLGGSNQDFITIGTNCTQCEAILESSDVVDDFTGASRTELILNSNLNQASGPSVVIINDGQFLSSGTGSNIPIVNDTGGNLEAIHNTYKSGPVATDLSGSQGANVIEFGVLTMLGTSPQLIVQGTNSSTLLLKPSPLSPNLPVCGPTIEGMRASVNNSTTVIYGAVISGGGIGHVPAYCNGTNWVVD